MAEKFKDIQDLYKFIDEISAQLQKEGFEKECLKLYDLIHNCAWTTSTELLGELNISLKQIKKQNKISIATKKNIDSGLKTINHYLKRW